MRKWQSRGIKLLIFTGVLVMSTALVNSVLWLTFSEVTYPRTTLAGVSLGARQYRSLDQPLEHILPATLNVTYQQKSIKISTDEAGFSVDPAATIASLKRQQSIFPLADIFRKYSVRPVLKSDARKLAKTVAAIAQTYHADPSDAKLAIEHGQFVLQPSSDGYTTDTAALQRLILAAMAQQQGTVTVPTVRVPATVQSTTLASQFQQLQKQQAASITFVDGSLQNVPSKAQIVAWYVADGQSFSPSSNAIQAYLNNLAKSWHVSFANIAAAVSGAQKALTTATTTNIALTNVVVTPAPAITYTYCVALRGVDPTNQGTFAAKLASTLNSTRGWSLGGKIVFRQVSQGCNFTAWLTASSQMPAFGAICDSTWSCTVSPNVVINFDRWQGASDSWNAAGGSLDDYRNMVINHETGHWLGFEHLHCGGPGQPAPVMQQQSINLEGCSFNPWPTAMEQQMLRTRLGL